MRSAPPQRVAHIVTLGRPFPLRRVTVVDCDDEKAARGEVAGEPFVVSRRAALPGPAINLNQHGKRPFAHGRSVDVQGETDPVPGWPILTRQPQRAPARVLDGAVVVDSLLSPGCRIEGRVERSVLGPGVVVAAGAVVRDSVVFPDTVVEARATVDWAVVDEHCRIGAGAQVGTAAEADPDGSVDPDLVSVVGRETSVPAGATLGPGSRLEPGTTS